MAYLFVIFKASNLQHKRLFVLLKDILCASIQQLSVSLLSLGSFYPQQCFCASVCFDLLSVFTQVAREAHFSGQSYLDLALTNVPSLRDNFYASFSFRTEKKEGLMFYHQDKVRQTYIFCSFDTSFFFSSGSCLPFPLSCTIISHVVYYTHSLPVAFECVQEGVCQVFLHEGHVVVRAGNSEIRTQKTYNDANSHYVAIYSNTNGYGVFVEKKQHALFKLA